MPRTKPSTARIRRPRADAMSGARIDDSDLRAMHAAVAWMDATLGWTPKKQPITIRLDDAIIRWFKRHGSGYQTRINHVLRTFVAAQTSRSSQPSGGQRPAGARGKTTTAARGARGKR